MLVAQQQAATHDQASCHRANFESFQAFLCVLPARLYSALATHDQRIKIAQPAHQQQKMKLQERALLIHTAHAIHGHDFVSHIYPTKPAHEAVSCRLSTTDVVHYISMRSVEPSAHQHTDMGLTLPHPAVLRRRCIPVDAQTNQRVAAQAQQQASTLWR